MTILDSSRSLKNSLSSLVEMSSPLANETAVNQPNLTAPVSSQSKAFVSIKSSAPATKSSPLPEPAKTDAVDEVFAELGQFDDDENLL